MRTIAVAAILSLGIWPAMARDIGARRGGVTGQAMLVVPVIAPPGGVWKYPLSTVVTVVSQQGQVVTQFATDADGRFDVRLKPGSYTLVPSSVPGSNGLPQAVAWPVSVTVQLTQPTPVVISYFGQIS